MKIEVSPEEFWLRLVYRGQIRTERKLDNLIGQLQDQAELLKLSQTLKKATDTLEQAIKNQK